jgi:hypothetical protein
VVFQTGTPGITGVIWYDTDEPDVVAVPVGGTAGQVLTKDSTTDYDTSWSTITIPEDVHIFLLMGA